MFLSAENTEDLSISSSLLTTLDGHGIFFSGYTRGAVVDRNEFVSIGETAVNQWGYTDGSPVPGMGWDARAGNQPRGTRVTYNLVHEVRIEALLCFCFLLPRADRYGPDRIRLGPDR